MINVAYFNKLKKYEPKLSQAYKGKFLCGMGYKTITDMIEIYNEVFDKEEVYTTCSKCIYKIVYELGEEYFKFKDAHPDADKPKKVGRPPKEEPKEIEVELADGSKGKMANSVERTDINGNIIRYK